MRKYTYSREIETLEGKEVFTAVEFDSFDEAKKAVDKGIYDRELQIKEELPRVFPGNKENEKVEYNEGNAPAAQTDGATQEPSSAAGSEEGSADNPVRRTSRWL